MKQVALIIYDDTGRVWGVYGGIDTVPAGVQGVIAYNAPLYYNSVSVDPQTHEVIWETKPDTENEVLNLQLALIELETRVTELEGGME